MRHDFPLYAGNPSQHFVDTLDKLTKYVENNNGRNNTYWSHNAVTRDRKKVLLRYIPFDFDSESDIEPCRRDLLRLRQWATAKGLDPLPVFSAGKGFHGYIEFKPLLFKADHDLQALYKGIQLTAVEEAGLETADAHLHGDHQRILRIPGTQHMKTGLFCNELPWKIVEEGVEACRLYSRAPRPALDRPEPSVTAPSWMLDNGLEPRQGSSGYGEAAPLAEYKGGDALIRNLLPRMCIHSAIVRQQVPHVVRFEAALTLAKSGFDPESITNFFMQVGRESGWYKLNREVTSQQVQQIWRQRQTYKLFSCGRLRSEGLCIGASCPLFKQVFGSENPSSEPVISKPTLKKTQDRRT